MSNREIKQESKDIIKSSKPSIFGMALIYILIMLLFNHIATRVAGFDMSQEELTKYFDLYMAQQFEEATEYALQFMPEKGAMVLDAVISIVKYIIDAGLLIFILHSVRKTGEATYANILDGFGIAVKLILMTILKGIIIGALCCLLVFPGIIAAYQYRQSTYLLIDHPDWGVVRCLSESKQMMKGNKGKLFSLDMSFIGWYLLCAIPGMNVWVMPYTKTAYTLFYNKLSNPYEYEQVI